MLAVIVLALGGAFAVGALIGIKWATPCMCVHVQTNRLT